MAAAHRQRQFADTNGFFETPAEVQRNVVSRLALVVFCLSIKGDLSRQLKSSSRIVSSAEGSALFLFRFALGRTDSSARKRGAIGNEVCAEWAEGCAR